MKTFTIQQGDTFDLNFQYKEDGTPTALPTGYNLVVGLYNAMGNLIQSGKTSDSSITQTTIPSVYKMSITHATSVQMVGLVAIEITIVGESGNVVDHASDLVYLNFETRKNNALLT